MSRLISAAVLQLQALCPCIFAKPNIKALREKIGELLDRVQAITDLAEQEKRELTDEEKTEIDEILDKQVPAVEAEIKRAEKIEAKMKEIAAARVNNPGQSNPGQADTGEGQGGVNPQQSDHPHPHAGASENERASLAATLHVPAAARRGAGSLKAYKLHDNPHATAEAYIAGMFLAAQLYQDKPARHWCDKHGIEIKDALSTGDNKLGGYLVVPEFEAAVTALRERYGVFRANVGARPMGSDETSFPKRRKGLTAYAVGENTALTESEKEWDNVEIIPKKFGVLTRYSSEISEDSMISLADDLAMDMARAFAFKEDDVGFEGTGVAADNGIVGLRTKLDDGNHDEAIHTALAGNTSFGELDLADFEAAAGLLPEFAEEDDPAWYVSKKGYWASMARLVDAGGGNRIEDLGRGPERIFLGYPVRVSQVLPKALGATVDTVLVLLGVPRLSSAMRERRGLRVMISEDRYFENDQLAIRGTVRFGIVNHTLTIFGEDNSTVEPGPVIGLKTPGA